MRAGTEYLNRRKDFWLQSYRNFSEIFMRPLPKISINCWLLYVGSIISRDFPFGSCDLQFADVLEGMK